MEYITAFLSHLFANIGGMASTLHTTTTVAGTWTTSTGTNTIDEADDTLLATVGTGIVSLGTAVIEASDDAIDEYKKQVSSVQTTQAYIESLPESELDEIIETLGFEDPKESQDEVRTLAKRL